MSSLHQEKELAQMSSDVASRNNSTESNPNHESPPPTVDEGLAHQPDHADKPSEKDKNLATEQVKLKKEREHPRGQRKEYEENTEKRDRAEKRGRNKSRHENEKCEAEGIEKGEPFKSSVISQQLSQRNSVPVSRRSRSRGLSRSKSVVSSSRRKTWEVSKNDEQGRCFEEMIDESLQPTPGAVKNDALPTETKWKRCHQKAASLWRSICRTPRIMYDGANSALSLFVTYFLRYLIMFLILILLFSITHRTICEIPLVKYYHNPCTAVWAPTPLSTDPQQDYALSQLAEPMQRHTEFLNQLQGNEYFEFLPMAVSESSRWMQHMQIVLQFTKLEIPSREETVKAIEEYVDKSEETSEKLSDLWVGLEYTVNRVLWERQDMVKDLKKIPSQPDDVSALSSVLDLPGLLWSFVATSLLGRSVLTPYQARQLEGEQARVDLLTASLPRINKWLAKLANEIGSVHKDFKALNKSIYEIQSLLVLDISKVSLSRDLLSSAESQPFKRFQALLGLRESQRFDILTHEAQLELLTSSNATVAVTIRELVVMTDVVRKLQNDLKIMTKTLETYKMSLADGRLSVDGLLRAVKVGVEALARGRTHYLERNKKQRQQWWRESQQRWKEPQEGIFQSQTEAAESMNQLHQLTTKQATGKNR